MSYASPVPSKPRRRILLGAASVSIASVFLSACAPPGGTAPSASVTQSSSVATAAPTEKVQLSLYLEQAGAGVPKLLAEEFTRQFPNVTFDIKSDTFVNLSQNAMKIITGATPPDLFRFPPVAQAAKAGALTSLDPYYEAFGWDEWPQQLIDQTRVAQDGSRGSGSLYGVGLGYNLTGVFYNKKIAASLGITDVPTTLADFEADALKAVSAGKTALIVNGKDAGSAYLLQMLQNSYGDVDGATNWIFQKPNATFELPAVTKAAQTVQAWTKSGIVPKGTNGVDYATAMGKFQAGEALFILNGDWEAMNLSKTMGEDVGFFLMPGETASAKVYTMAAPATYVVPVGAAHKDEIAFFLNWVHTNDKARQILTEQGGVSPGGPTSLSVPTASNALVKQTTTAFGQIAQSGGAVDFYGNATLGMLSTTLMPELQALIEGSTTPEAFAKAVQQGYNTELGR